MGHIVSKEVVLMDPENIKYIMEKPSPQNLVEIRSFVWLEENHLRFIHNFSKIRYQIKTLQRKEIKFQWTWECVAIFEQLKHLATHALILILVDPEKDFVVYIDACREAFDGVLMQEI